jgi:hypothetical protein
MNYDSVPPRADALIEAVRAFGYTPHAAIADLIDNSITAEATDIHLTFRWAGEDSVIAVVDNGKGMDEDTLREAMRLGTHNPSDTRTEADLGRFGLGLKSASFSQCRSVTVASRPAGGNGAVRRWDLDHIARTRDWQLLKTGTPVSRPFEEALETAGNGTVVVWEKLDRVLASTGTSGKKAEDLFLAIAETAEQHLAMTFHRFLKGRGRIRISINGSEIEPWDPFLADHPATQMLTEEGHPAFGEVVGVTPYVLPHASKLEQPAHKRAAGPRGWNAQQGFYVYRNKRLLVPGSWLYLGFKKEEHFKLARIQIDIPNSMDAEWKIDVKKSVASPPGVIRDDLRRIARLTRKEASHVYRHRGKTVARKVAKPGAFVWVPHIKEGRRSFQINRQYPLIQALLSSPEASAVRTLLRVVEETVPIPAIWIDVAEHPDEHAGPLEQVESDELDELLIETLRSLHGAGYRRDEAVQRLKIMEPFQDYGPSIEACAGRLEWKAEQ